MSTGAEPTESAPAEGRDRAGRWSRALLLVGAYAGLCWTMAGTPHRPIVAMPCRFAVEVDGRLSCDDEAPREVSPLCGDARGERAAIRGGDALESETLCGRGVPERGGPGWGRMSPDALAALEQPVDVNAADLEELQSLPGVGPAIARRIVAARPHRRPEDLVRVRGIGPTKLRRMRHRLAF